MPGRTPALDSPEARDTVLQALADGETLEDAGKRIGISRRAITKYSDKHPEFRDRLMAARQRRKCVSRAAVRKGGPGELGRQRPKAKPRPKPSQTKPSAPALAPLHAQLVADADAEPGPTVEVFIEHLWAVAQDGDSRAQGRALHLLAEYKLGPIVRAHQRAEERAARAEEAAGATDVLVPIVHIPVNGTEVDRDDGIIDAEVVER